MVKRIAVRSPLRQGRSAGHTKALPVAAAAQAASREGGPTRLPWNLGLPAAVSLAPPSQGRYSTAGRSALRSLSTPTRMNRLLTRTSTLLPALALLAAPAVAQQRSVEYEIAFPNAVH